MVAATNTTTITISASMNIDCLRLLPPTQLSAVRPNKEYPRAAKERVIAVASDVKVT
jgi:hypothetical protein